jgi:hypothetical protein
LIDGNDATAVFRLLASGVSEARLTREASAVLERLNRREKAGKLP